MRRSTGSRGVGLEGVVEAQELILRPPQASSPSPPPFGIIRNNDRLLNAVARQSKLPGAALSVKATDGGKFQILEIQVGDETFLFRSQKVIGQANRTVSVMKQESGGLHSVGPVQHLLHQWEVTQTRKIERQRSLEGARLRQKASVGTMQLLDPTRSRQVSLQKEHRTREIAARKRQRHEPLGPCPSSQTLVYAFIQYDDSMPLVPISPPGNVISPIENDEEYHACSALYHQKQTELLALQARLVANCNDFKELALAMNAQKVAAKQREISRFRQKLHVVRKDSITKLKDWYQLLSVELETMASFLDAYYQQKIRSSLAMVSLL